MARRWAVGPARFHARRALTAETVGTVRRTRPSLRNTTTCRWEFPPGLVLAGVPGTPLRGKVGSPVGTSPTYGIPLEFQASVHWDLKEADGRQSACIVGMDPEYAEAPVSGSGSLVMAVGAAAPVPVPVVRLCAVE